VVTKNSADSATFQFVSKYLPLREEIVYNILYTVSTQQLQYSDIMYAVGYNVATCFDCKPSSSGQ